MSLHTCVLCYYTVQFTPAVSRLPEPPKPPQIHIQHYIFAVYITSKRFSGHPGKGVPTVSSAPFPTSRNALLLAAGGLSRGGAFARSAHLDSVLSPLSCRNKKGFPTEGDPSHQISQKTRIDPHGPMCLNWPLTDPNDTVSPAGPRPRPTVSSAPSPNNAT